MVLPRVAENFMVLDPSPAIPARIQSWPVKMVRVVLQGTAPYFGKATAACLGAEYFELPVKTPALNRAGQCAYKSAKRLHLQHSRDILAEIS